MSWIIIENNILQELYILDSSGKEVFAEQVQKDVSSQYLGWTNWQSENDNVLMIIWPV